MEDQGSIGRRGRAMSGQFNNVIAPMSNGWRKLLGDSIAKIAGNSPGQAPSTGNAFTEHMFSVLDTDGSKTVSSQLLIQLLKDQGLKIETDPRFTGVYKELQDLNAFENDRKLKQHEFDKVIGSAISLINKALEGKLCIPDFKKFSAIIKEVYDIVEKNEGGANADYIPQLAAVNPDQFAISITTVDGQQLSLGDSEVQFCIQSCSKPISYLVALNEFGPEYVHNHVGTEPSGRKFNEMCLKPAPEEGKPNREIPHNPLINAGAIMTTSMVAPSKTPQERLEHVIQIWRKLSGDTDGTKIGYDEPTYKSESGTADRNWCLGYMMKESGAFPPVFQDLDETLQLYFQLCSILSDCDSMSVMAATLANGGLNPITGEKVFNPEHIRFVLPLMLTSGMYDYSGQWAFDIGVPAKSGVGGSVFIVIPNLAGITIWSPRLDEVGNSVRGVHVMKELLQRLEFHTFEVFSGLSRTKMDPRGRFGQAKDDLLGEILFAASQGDTYALQTLKNAGGINFSEADYDYRTVLHLAASEGHVEAVEFVIEAAQENGNALELLQAKDRWGGTPLTDAISHGHTDCEKVLREAGATTDSSQSHSLPDGNNFEVSENQQTFDAIFAAARGELGTLLTLRATGTDLTGADYDGRTAAHLAASEGNVDILRYIYSQHGANSVLTPKDRFNNTPLDDCIRENHTSCRDYLQSLEAEKKPTLSEVLQLGNLVTKSLNSSRRGGRTSSVVATEGERLSQISSQYKSFIEKMQSGSIKES